MFSAFQSNAFQNSAFQIVVADVEEAINPTGIGAVVDYRARDKAQAEWDKRQQANELDRRASVERAFDILFKETPKQIEITESKKEQIAKFALGDLKGLGFTEQLEQIRKTVNLISQQIKERRQMNNKIRLLLLLS